MEQCSNCRRRKDWGYALNWGVCRDCLPLGEKLIREMIYVAEPRQSPRYGPHWSLRIYSRAGNGSGYEIMKLRRDRNSNRWAVWMDDMDQQRQVQHELFRVPEDAPLAQALAQIKQTYTRLEAEGW